MEDLLDLLEVAQRRAEPNEMTERSCLTCMLEGVAKLEGDNLMHVQNFMEVMATAKTELGREATQWLSESVDIMLHELKGSDIKGRYLRELARQARMNE